MDPPPSGLLPAKLGCFPAVWSRRAGRVSALVAAASLSYGPICCRSNRRLTQGGRSVVRNPRLTPAARQSKGRLVSTAGCRQISLRNCVTSPNGSIRPLLRGADAHVHQSRTAIQAACERTPTWKNDAHTCQQVQTRPVLPIPAGCRRDRLACLHSRPQDQPVAWVSEATANSACAINAACPTTRPPTTCAWMEMP